MTPGDRREVQQPVSGDRPAGLSQPALRALRGAGLRTLEQIAQCSRRDLIRLHGIGPKAIDQLNHALAEKGLCLR